MQESESGNRVFSSIEEVKSLVGKGRKLIIYQDKVIDVE